MVVPDGKAAGDVVGEAAEVVAHALTDRFECLEAGGARRGVDADALDRAMVDRNEHRRRALARYRRGQIGAPHRVHRLRDGASRSFSPITRSTRGARVRDWSAMMEQG